tara:strand:- start:699 stop:1367 length:669 start_codon:yes stop_codon:yes gene_type:complete
MKITLIYPDFPFWRAEVARVSLYIGSVDFEDLRITLEEFQKVKETGLLDNGTVIPFHQLPCLQVDGVSIAQTAGIARLCGKISGLYPLNDNILSAIVDQFIDFATDITVLISSAGKAESESEKRINRQKLYKGDLTKKLKILEKNLKENSDLILEKMTVADIAIWRLMGWLSGGMLDGFPEDILKHYPRIRRLCNTVDSYSKIQEWIEKTYPKNYKRGNFKI